MRQAEEVRAAADAMRLGMVRSWHCGDPPFCFRRLFAHAPGLQSSRHTNGTPDASSHAASLLQSPQDALALEGDKKKKKAAPSRPQTAM